MGQYCQVFKRKKGVDSRDNIDCIFVILYQKCGTTALKIFKERKRSSPAAIMDSLSHPVKMTMLTFFKQGH